MDYVIRRRADELDSTGYVEIGPGRYTGKHWQDGFLFVWEDAFGMAEGIVAKHLPAYDHFEMNEIPRDVGLAITAEWRDVAAKLRALSPVEAHAALNLDASYHARLNEELSSHREEIAQLLRELAEECERFYLQGDWICVLGM
jgi:hypothetical protein